MPRLGMGELLIILVIVVVLFGASKLPQLGAGLGQGIKSFKRALGGDDDKDDSAKPGSDDTSNKPGAEKK
jgi:sec-independent protein translocase protein TatA